MAERIHPLLRKAIADQLDGKTLARLFNLGGIVVSREDGSIGVIPGAELEIEIQESGSDKWTRVELPRWNLPDGNLALGELVVIAANFGQGQQGKKDRATWNQQDSTTEDAALRDGYSVVGGHRGGARPANKSPVLMALFRTPPSKRKYR